MLERFRIFRRKKEEPVVEKQVEPAREEPTGRILAVQDNVRGQLIALVGRFKKADYTTTELRDAAKLPPIAGVIRTIMREVNSYGLEVDEKDPTDDDRPKRMLEDALSNPNDFDRTFRVTMTTMMRDWLVLGKSYIRLLREEKGQAPAIAEAYRRGEITADEFMERVIKAKAQPGAILGFIAHDPDNIRPNATAQGVWKTPAFYDVTTLGPFAQTAPIGRLSKVPSFTTDQMVMIQFTGTTETERRLDPPSPTADAYPLIDILYAMLVMLRGKLDRPQMDKLLSFVIPKDAQQMSPEQITTLVTDMREDIAQGTLPVLPYVQAMVNEIGMGQTWEAIWGIFQEIAIIAWQIFGAGGVQMLRMEGQGRQAAGQQMEAARKQAIGNMLRIIAEDFVTTTIIKDKWSPYSGLKVKWVDKAEILSPTERLEREHLPLLEMGYPLGAVLTEDYPEKIAILQAAGIDPWDLYLPQITAAMLKMTGELPGEEQERTGMESLVEMLTAAGKERAA